MCFNFNYSEDVADNVYVFVIKNFLVNDFR